MENDENGANWWKMVKNDGNCWKMKKNYKSIGSW